MKTGFHAWGSRPTAQWSEAEQVPLGYARPSDTLAAEKNFSDAHVAGKMIQMIRVCGRELCEAFEPWLTMMLVKI